MGQYYIVANLTKGVYFSPSGFKLTEHCWFNDFAPDYIMHLLEKEWAGDQIVWAGHYGDELLFIEDQEEAFDGKDRLNLHHYAVRHWRAIEPPSEVPDIHPKDYYLVNHDLKEYVTFCALVDDPEDEDEYEDMPHPLPLLCASGNGRGGGDYRPQGYAFLREHFSRACARLREAESNPQQAPDAPAIRAELEDVQNRIESLDPNIGRWAGHRISAAKKPPKGYKGFFPYFQAETDL